jgi:hypothetical protein
MFIKGLGIKTYLQTLITGVIKLLFPVGTLYNAPRKTISTAEYLTSKRTNKINGIIRVYEGYDRVENPPEIFNYPITRRFTKYLQRQVPEAYVLILNKGMIYGQETNYVITDSFRLVSEVSREFGMYGGKPMIQSNLIKKTLKLPPINYLRGKVAVITTSGANNFHHWNYDCIPRIHLLKQAGLFDEIDSFIVSYKGLPFQEESLKLLGVEADKIFNPSRAEAKALQAECLYVPSLPSQLGTVSPWVVGFLRNTYNPANEKTILCKRIYLSRKNVGSRKILNNDEFNSLLKEFDVMEIFPEDYTVSTLGKILSAASFIISIHGSGLSNLCFISESTTVVDILAPYHQDGYYWMISNIRESKYIGFFGEGDHPEDHVDLVRRKIDEDIYLDLVKMRSLLERETVAV